MITVETSDTPYGSRLLVQGHADPDTEAGRLACASASTLLATALFALHGGIHRGAPGHVDTVLPDTLFDWSIAWLEMLRDTYPDQLTIARHDARRPQP